MAEWWSYRLEDFLLFSPRTYFRLHELYNLEIWPAQLVALALGVLVLVLGLQHGRVQRRIAMALLALGWCWVAWAFHYRHYATINWAAPWFGAAFAVEAGLLAWFGVLRGAITLNPFRDWRTRAGLALFVFALLLHPPFEVLLGRSWMEAGVFGTSPDPTVLATLGILLMARHCHRLLLPVPLAWCAVGGATLWTMDAPGAWLLPAAGALVLLCVSCKGRSAI